MQEELDLPLPLVQRPPVLEERWEALGREMNGVLFPAEVEAEEAP